MAQQYFKTNYAEIFKIITPQCYLEEDISLSGLEVSPLDQVLNTHLVLANNLSSILPISAVGSLSTINTLSGIAPYFVKQNKLTNITPFEFERSILNPLGHTLADYSSSSAFKSFLDILLPSSLRLNAPTTLFEGTASGSHNYLADYLGWMYFLNTSGNPYSPSAFVSQKLTENIFFGKNVELFDAMEGVTEFLWKNYYTSSNLQNLALIPPDYLSGVKTYTSGTQQLDKLKTLIGILYSPLYRDKADTKVKDALQDYIDLGNLIEDFQSKGPFWKFLKAISYGLWDVNSDIEKINSIYDLENCPDEYLPYVAELIGWKLLGYDPIRWRLQLRSAVQIYKAKGTKRAIQLAVDSIFTNGVFNLSGNILELWESYIPNMMYYLLATESPILQSLDTWTKDVATTFGVTDYDNTNQDTNVRYAVDYLLLNTVKTFPANFLLNNAPFDLKKVYNYRGRDFPIPPWEEERFYESAKVDYQVADYLAHKLECYGVSSTYTTTFNDCIKEKCLSAFDLIYLDNAFLFFTSGSQLPPNYTEIIKNVEKTHYIPLWNSKSSHFNLTLFASSFTYNTKSLNADTSLAFLEAIRAVDLFAPTHAIPDINLLLQETDTGDLDDDSCPAVIMPDSELYDGSGFNPGFELSGVNMQAVASSFDRFGVDNIRDPLMSTSALAGTNAPRNLLRRRNHKNILPKTGLYLRTGFNMPASLLGSTLELSLASSFGWLPLGLIPSSYSYQAISSYDSIPNVYGYCENLSSIQSFYGVAVSNTYPCRGIVGIYASACHSYTERCELDPLIASMHRVLRIRNKKLAEIYYKSNVSSFNTSSWLNVMNHLTNQYDASTFALPNIYQDFEYGTGVHKLYKDYTDKFNRHALPKAILEAKGGFDIFSHTYGPLVYNGNLQINGSAILASSQLINSAVNNPAVLNNQFTSGTVLGTYVASSTSALYIDNFEFRNPHIVSGVELVLVSGSQVNNSFTVYKISNEFSSPIGENFSIGNTLIKSKSLNGFNRLRFDINAYGPNSNYFIPEHEFNLNLSAFIGREEGFLAGGGTIGAFIHTRPEGNLMWVWTNRNQWEVVSVTSVNSNYINKNCQFKEIPLQDLSNEVISNTDEPANTPCITTNSEGNPIVNSIGIENLKSKYFTNLNFYFNTFNQPISVPQSYYQSTQQVHRSGQKYVVEVFQLPINDPNYFTLFDSVSIKDITEFNRLNNEYDKEDLWNVLRYFNDLIVGDASRVVSNTSGQFYTSGGSRLNYRIHPQWTNPSYTTNLQISSIDFKN